MSFIDKINALIDNVDPGKAEFIVGVRKDYISIRAPAWDSNISNQGYYESLLKRTIIRTYLNEGRRWLIDRDRTISSIQNQIIYQIYEIFRSCSPTKEPKRTKIYKSFCAMLGENKGKIDFINSIADVSEYYYLVTKTEPIKNINNDVHRKNIYQLLCLMEKSYVKRKTNSNG